MQDRLAEIQRPSRKPEILETETDELMPDFNKKINEIKESFREVKENNQEIMRLNKELKSATTSDNDKVLRGRINKAINEITKTCNRIKNDLEIVENEVERAKKHEKNEPETKIKEITYKSYKSKFAEVLKETQSAQIDVKNGIKNTMIRQVKAVDPTLDQEKVEEIVTDPNGYEKLQAGKVLGAGAHIRLKNTVADIKDKYKDIQKLENNIETIHQMFVDIQMLVQAQGDALDNIELNVQETVHYTQKANKELKKAKESHKKARKCKCIILLVLLIIIIVAVAIVLPVTLK